MRLLSFIWGSKQRVGAYVNNVVMDLPETYMRIYETDNAPNFLYDMKSLIEGGEPIMQLIRDLINRALKSGNAVVRDPASITWLPPVPVGVGLWGRSGEGF